MIIQDVKKECLARTGVTIEFSNSEVYSLDCVLKQLSNAIRSAQNTFRRIANAATPYKDTEDVNVAVDLKTLMRLEWLLTRIASRVYEHSAMFDEADAAYSSALRSINDASNKPAE